MHGGRDAGATVATIGADDVVCTYECGNRTGTALSAGHLGPCDIAKECSLGGNWTAACTRWDDTAKECSLGSAGAGILGVAKECTLANPGADWPAADAAKEHLL